MTTRRTMWALLAGAMLMMAVAVAAAQGSGACSRECLIGLTEAYLSAMVARDPTKAPVTANARFTQNTRPMSLGQGVWESIKGVRGYKLFITDPTAGQIALYTVVDGTERPGLLTLRMKVDGQRISEIESVYVGIGQTGFGSTEPTYTLPSGEVVKHSETMLRKQAVVVSELFKIEDGRIRRIEAVMAGGLPLDAASGW